MFAFVIVLVAILVIAIANLVLLAFEQQQSDLAEFRQLFGSPDSDTAHQAFLDTFGVAWNAPNAAYAVKRHIHELPSGIDKHRDIILAHGYNYKTAYWY